MGVTYTTGLGRGNSGYDLQDETHIYACDTQYEPSRPLCKRGFNRDFGSEFSIFRGNVGSLGVCAVCDRRQKEGHTGLSWKRSRKLKKRIQTAEKKGKYSPLLPGQPREVDLSIWPWAEQLEDDL